MWLEYFTDSEHAITFLWMCSIAAFVLSMVSVSLHLFRDPLDPLGARDVELYDYRQSLPERFHDGEEVITLGELNYSHGNGMIVPGGADLKLLRSHHTTNGVRWSALWKDRIYVYPIPEDLIQKKQPA